jgi:hypothetical protein
MLIKALEAQVATLREQLAAAEARAEGLTADLASERAKVEAERTKADKAITEFAGLADALTKIAAERVRPWWWRWRWLAAG